MAWIIMCQGGFFWSYYNGALEALLAENKSFYPWALSCDTIEWKVFKGVTNPTKEYIGRNSILWLFYDSPIGLIRNLFNIMRKKPHNPKIETHNHHNWDCNWCHAWHQSFRSRKVSKHIRLRHKSSSLLL